MLKKLLAKIWKPKCRQVLVPVYEKAIDREYAWTTERVSSTSGIAPSTYQTTQHNFTGIAFLKYEYCPLCCRGLVSLRYPAGYIPYETDYLLNMVSHHMKEDGINVELSDLITEKCQASGYHWDSEKGSFNNKEAV